MRLVGKETNVDAFVVLLTNFILRKLTDILSVRFLIVVPISTAITSLPKIVLLFSSWRKKKKKKRITKLQHVVIHVWCLCSVIEGETEIFYFLTLVILRNRNMAANGTLTFMSRDCRNASFGTAIDLENTSSLSLSSTIWREEHNEFGVIVRYVYSLKPNRKDIM